MSKKPSDKLYDKIYSDLMEEHEKWKKENITEEENKILIFQLFTSLLDKQTHDLITSEIKAFKIKNAERDKIFDELQSTRKFISIWLIIGAILILSKYFFITVLPNTGVYFNYGIILIYTSLIFAALRTTILSYKFYQYPKKRFNMFVLSDFSMVFIFIYIISISLNIC